MTEQQRALQALKDADVIYRQADAHRSELIGLVRRLGVPLTEIERALGLPTSSRSRP